MRRRPIESMRRRPILIGLGLLSIFGFLVYLRLWAIDSDLTYEDRDYIRRQFDLANKEAMDESAEWRYKYDNEVDRATNCHKELLQVKEALERKVKEAANANKKLAMLQKENIGLLDRVKSLTQELQTEKLRCNG